MGKHQSRDPSTQLQMPPGFRFRPTDEELVVHYLCKQAAAQPFAVPIIAEVDLYSFDPWDLPEKALLGEKEWYFFSPRDRKYPNGSRPNRSAGSGFWKATGVDKPITTLGGSLKVGVKKALVFYEGRAPKGVKTNWIMHEYRLADSASKAAKRKGSLRLDDWVLCRIYNKTSSAQKALGEEKGEKQKSCLDDLLDSFPGVNDLQGCTTMEQEVESDPNAMSHLSNEESGHDSVGDNSEDSTSGSWLHSSSAPLPVSLSSAPAPLFSPLLPAHPARLSTPAPTAAAATTTHTVSSRPLPPPLSTPSPPPEAYTTITSPVATCRYAAQTEFFPFNFDGLPSPFWRQLEPLQLPYFGDGGN